MRSIPFSSGDVLADRRADYARMLAEAGDLKAAGELLAQALERAPSWPAGWFRLGEYREKAAERQGAIDAYRQALLLDPKDAFGARLKLAVLGVEDVPAQPPSRYVENLFDDYAGRFEAALVERLHYRIPEKIADDLLTGHGPFRLTIDLGCGTGLFGEKIRRSTARLEGFDLSANMLARAARKRLYDHLGRADLSLDAPESGLFGPDLAPGRADLIVAADVLIYLGSLETVFPLVQDLLAPSGLFAFSVESADRGEGFVLRETLRYAHAGDYVEALVQRFGLRLLAAERADIRLDRGKPVPGMLFLSQRPA